MTYQLIQTQLDKLANIQAERDVLILDKQAKIDSVLTPEIRAHIADIEAEYSPDLEAAEEAIMLQTDFVKRLVIEAGESVKGEFLHAVYAKGRVSWDSKSLDGYAVAHPEINAMRKQGDPSVSIRKV